MAVGYTGATTGGPRVFSTEVDQPKAEKGDYKTLEECKRLVSFYYDNKREEIEEQQDFRRYRHGAQWTASQVEVFNKRKQPVVTYNRISRKIDSIIGLVEKLKQDPKAYPKSPSEHADKGAELATTVVRHVMDAELRDHCLPFVFENLAVDGVGAVEMLLVRGDKGDVDIGFALVDTDSFIYDPRSFRHDFSDARFMGNAKWMDVDDLKDLFPDKSKDIDDSFQSGNSEFTTNPDREKKWFDFDSNHKRVRVVDLYYRHRGGWCWSMFTGALILDEGKGVFYNEKNEQICKFIAVSCFIDHDGDRYGFVRGLRSSQDEINQRRSKGLHELNSRRIKAEDGAFADVELTRREAVRPDGVVLYNKGFEMEFDDAARIANVEGQLKFLEDAKNEIENFGPNPALIGQGLEYKSGRAINLLQQAGLAELGPFMIGVRQFRLRLYRAIWAAVQRYWTAERWIRVVDDEGIAQFVQLNGVGIDPATGFPRMINGIAQLDVSIVLDEGPDEVNMMADAYDTLVALTAQGANIPPEILLELAPLQASVKRKIMAMLTKPDPMKEQAKQVAIEGETAKVKETESKVMLNVAKAQETGQGQQGAMQEKIFDAQLKEREDQRKAQQAAQELMRKREESRMELAAKARESAIDERALMIKAQQSAREGQQKIIQNEAVGAQRLRQSQDSHELKMQQLKQQPKAPAGGSK